MLGPRGLARYALDLAIIGVAYFVLAKVGSTLVSIHLIAVPIWPATGLALAAVLLRGLRVWPAIFIAALAAGAPTDNATFAGSLLTSAGVAAGQTLAALVGGYLVEHVVRWPRNLRYSDRSREIRCRQRRPQRNDRRDRRRRQLQPRGTHR